MEITKEIINLQITPEDLRVIGLALAGKIESRNLQVAALELNKRILEMQMRPLDKKLSNLQRAMEDTEFQLRVLTEVKGEVVSGGEK